MLSNAGYAEELLSGSEVNLVLLWVCLKVLGCEKTWEALNSKRISISSEFRKRDFFTQKSIFCGDFVVPVWDTHAKYILAKAITKRMSEQLRMG